MHSATKTFEYRSIIPTSYEAIRAFHENPRALSQLTPPPLVIQLLRDARISLIEGEVEFRLWLGPVPIRWLARHEPGPTPTSFIDRMILGPMSVWEHQHSFHPIEHGVELTDRITLAHHAGWKGLLTRLMFDGLPLRLLFIFRHWRTRRALNGSKHRD